MRRSSAMLIWFLGIRFVSILPHCIVTLGLVELDIYRAGELGISVILMLVNWVPEAQVVQRPIALQPGSRRVGSPTSWSKWTDHPLLQDHQIKVPRTRPHLSNNSMHHSQDNAAGGEIATLTGEKSQTSEPKSYNKGSSLLKSSYKSSY